MIVSLLSCLNSVLALHEHTRKFWIESSPIGDVGLVEDVIQPRMDFLNYDSYGSKSTPVRR